MAKKKKRVKAGRNDALKNLGSKKVFQSPSSRDGARLALFVSSLLLKSLVAASGVNLLTIIVSISLPVNVEAPAFAQTTCTVPCQDSEVGDTVTIDGGEEATVVELLSNNDPNSATAVTAWVKLDNDEYYNVLSNGQSYWFNDEQYEVSNITATSTSATFTSVSNPSLTNDVSLVLNQDGFVSTFPDSSTSDSIPQSTRTYDGSDGVVAVAQGSNGGNGSFGIFFVPPGDGGNGDTLDDLNVSFPNVSNIEVVSTQDPPNPYVSPFIKAGLEVGSIGGNGGKGGDSVFNFWSPGDGGTGASGGDVNVTNNMDITTKGSYQRSGRTIGIYGIFAYSISGTGGDGGDGVLAPGGGTGGGSLSGGSVEVTNNGNVSTNGENSHAIYAISRAGNGGDGGFQVGLFGSSGSGGASSNGGNVTVTNSLSGELSTDGLISHGIYATSIGGAGGDGGNSWNAFYSDADVGGGGGSGGDIDITNAGSIITNQSMSRGIYGSSIGGGGGSGGDAGSLVSFGGSGSEGGAAGLVTIENLGSIRTNADVSDGIYAQSIAGGGGAGGDSGGLVSIGGTGDKGGDGGSVTVVNSGSIETGFNFDFDIDPDTYGGRGIVAQSIGGGGGDGGDSGGMFAIGGSGDGGGKGGTVTVENSGSIVTYGPKAIGVFAQSVGGGGGNGGDATAVGAFFSLAIGGDGASGGEGGVVKVTTGGALTNGVSSVTTTGDNSTGIFAQSVGGGGGNGGGSLSIAVGAFGALSIGIGGTGGGGGLGGDVTLEANPGTSLISTSGDNSGGLFAQSVGGGGGNGGQGSSAPGNAGTTGSAPGASLTVPSGVRTLISGNNFGTGGTKGNGGHHGGSGGTAGTSGNAGAAVIFDNTGT